MLYRIAVIFIWLLLLSGLIPAQVSGLAPQSGPQSTPLPVNSLHQWGAVTLFHGLPSDRVNAIAQTPDGALWFGTDGGLARYDGRRTQTINAAGLPTGRVLALQTDAGGALWLGTERGAARLSGDHWQTLAEITNQTVRAFLVQPEGLAWAATEQGQVFECRINSDGTVTARALDAAFASS